MRSKFFEKLLELTVNDREIFFITSDLGYGLCEEYRNKFPSNFLNVGVSEQAMAGIASGMSNMGAKVFCYSIASFSFLRPFEIYRNGVFSTKNPVMIIGVGAGFDYSHDGLSHYCFEDLALAQSQPNLHIALASYDIDIDRALDDFIENPRPTYLRLPRSEPKVKNVEILNQEINNLSGDVLILSYGLMLDRAFSIYQLYVKAGFSTDLFRVAELSEESLEAIKTSGHKFKFIHVIEDHYEFGGLATKVSSILKSRNTNIIFDAIKSTPIGEVGSRDFMEKKLFEDSKQIIQRVRENLSLEQ